MKPQIMFIDDEKNILDGIESNLYKKRKEWDLFFFSSPAEAITSIQGKTYDVVVTDMRMPGFTGTTVLQRLREVSPSTVRILLSGQADTASLVQSIPNVHHYIRKPCEGSALQAAIERALSLRERLFDESLRSGLGKQETLPANPANYWQLIAGIENDSPPDVLCKIIEGDPGIYAKVLQLANSAYFGSNASVVSVDEAVSILGDDWFRLMAMSSHIFVPFEPVDVEQERTMLRLWKRAIITRNLVTRMVENEFKAQAFTAGLLHVVGEQWLLTEHRERYAACCAHQRSEGSSLLEHLTVEFGADTGEIGAYLLALWGLPLSVVTAIKFIHRPFVAPMDGRLDINTALQVAASMTMSAVSEVQVWPTQDVAQWLSSSSYGPNFYAHLEEELKGFGATDADDATV